MMQAREIQGRRQGNTGKNRDKDMLQACSLGSHLQRLIIDKLEFSQN
jgi:hypothetical protein